MLKGSIKDNNGRLSKLSLELVSESLRLIIKIESNGAIDYWKVKQRDRIDSEASILLSRSMNEKLARKTRLEIRTSKARNLEPEKPEIQNQKFHQKRNQKPAPEKRFKLL